MSRLSTTSQFRRDDGMSLVELILYSGLSMLFLTVLAGIFVTSWQADAATRDRDAATGAAHVVTNSIQTSIRNASSFKVDGSLLRARVATPGGGWECRAWRLIPLAPQPIEGEQWYELQYNHGNTAIDGASAGWTNLLGGLGDEDDMVLLVQGDPDAAAPFGEQGRLLTVTLRVGLVDLDDHRVEALVPVNADTVPQAWGDGSPASCW